MICSIGVPFMILYQSKPVEFIYSRSDRKTGAKSLCHSMFPVHCKPLPISEVLLPEACITGEGL